MYLRVTVITQRQISMKGQKKQKEVNSFAYMHG